LFPGLQSEYKFPDRKITILPNLWYKMEYFLKNGVNKSFCTFAAWKWLIFQYQLVPENVPNFFDRFFKIKIKLVIIFDMIFHCPIVGKFGKFFACGKLAFEFPNSYRRFNIFRMSGMRRNHVVFKIFRFVVFMAMGAFQRRRTYLQSCAVFDPNFDFQNLNV